MDASDIRAITLLSALVLLSCAQPEPKTATSGHADILCSESIAPLISAEAQKFGAIYETASISVVPTSTRDAFVQLLNDSVVAAAVDRALNAEERAVISSAQLAFTETKIGTDALVVLVNKSSSLKSISLDALRSILSSQSPSWQDVPGSGLSGALVLVLPGRNSGMYEILQHRFLQPGKLIEPGVAVHTQDEIGNEVSKNRRAFGIVTASWYFGVRDSVRELPFRALEIKLPDTTISVTQENIYHESYPLTIPLYYYTKESKLGPASGLATFLMSLDGQKIIQQAGIVPVRIPSRTIQLTKD